MARLPRKTVTALTISALLLLPATGLAADAQTPVAHVSFANGTVTLRSGGGEVRAAAVNMPLFVGDELSTDRGALAEIQLDAATMIRVGARTHVLVTDLAAGHRELRLDRGDVEMRVFRQAADARVRTPSITVVAKQTGAYRVSVGQNEETEVVVHSGRAGIPLPGGGELALLPGTTLVAGGSPSNPEISYRSTIASDDFDRWNEQRDGQTSKDVAYADTTLNPALAANALDGYGRWLNYGSYGSAWSPFVGAGWAPYTLGSWINTPLFGPTWLSSEPWGWAPYHYGRWVYDAAYGWLWVPGSAAAWAPALVGFIPLFTSNPFGTSPFGPNIGWVPLAPGEFYQPWWGGQAGAPVVISNGNFINARRLYTRPNFDRASVPSSIRYLQSSKVTAPMHVAPNIRMSAPAPSRAVVPRPVTVRVPAVRYESTHAVAAPAARR